MNRRHYAGPQPLPPELAARYAYPPRPSPGQADIQLLDEHRRYRRFLVRFPLVAPDFEPTEPVVELEWYECKRPGRRPAILFNPILGGDYPLERSTCRFFANRGFHVALVRRKTLKVSPDKPIAHLELLLRQGVLRIRQAVDWMAAQDRVDAQRMASFGISMGAMASVMSAAVEPRLRCHVAAMAGGSIADILVSTHDAMLTKPRARYLAAHGMDLKMFEAQVREAVKTDPLLLAPYADARQLLTAVALLDRTIGRQNGFRLWRRLGKPDVILLPTGHYTAYLYLPVIKRVALAFFRRHLLVRSP
ncbi:MAG: hypothetical protein HYZ92_01390 [Candidatus Omnitrophica bacterium]|nr:hypothetical protein [Candidatus Omnitrophota bacterium]